MSRALRVSAAAGFAVVALTVIHGAWARGFLLVLAGCALWAAITGYGPLYPYLSRLRGKNAELI